MGNQTESQLPVCLLYKPEPLLQEKLSQYCHSIVGGRDLCYGFELMAQILKL